MWGSLLEARVADHVVLASAFRGENHLAEIASRLFEKVRIDMLAPSQGLGVPSVRAAVLDEVVILVDACTGSGGEIVRLLQLLRGEYLNPARIEGELVPAVRIPLVAGPVEELIA